MRGIQCEKSLFFSIYRPELEPETDPGTQAQFDEGHEVGFWAQKEFPGSVLIEAEYWDYEKAIGLTQKAIDAGASAVFEAAFGADGCFAKIDILNRKKKSGPWSLIEVKKTGSVKDVHIPDVAIQYWIATQAGIKIDKCFLMHLNTKCFAPKWKNLFIRSDITDEVLKALPEVIEKIKNLQVMVRSKKEPKVDIGPPMQRSL